MTRGLLRGAVKASSYIHLGYPDGGYRVPNNQSIIYRDDWDPRETATGKRMTDSEALTYVPFFAGVRLLSESVGRLPFFLYKRVGKDDRERADDKILYRLLHDEPNPAMSAMVFRSALHGHVVTRGNCFAERVKDDLGRDYELWPLRPDRTKVLLDEGTGRKFFRVRIESLGDEVDLSADRVFHIPGFGYDGLVGYSVISLFRESLALGLAAQEFGAKFFKNGARPAGVITHPKGMSKQGLREFVSSFQGKNAGLSNAQRIAIIEEGFKYESVGLSLEDSQFVETRGFQKGEASTMLLIPPHLIGDVSRSTSWGTGIEEQTLGFITFGLGSHLELWSQETDRQLVRPAYGAKMFSEFELNALLAGRASDRLAFYQGLWQMGAINADTIARRENLPPPGDGSGQTYYKPLNYGRTLQPGDEAAQQLAEIADAVLALARAGMERDSIVEALNAPMLKPNPRPALPSGLPPEEGGPPAPDAGGA